LLVNTVTLGSAGPIIGRAITIDGGSTNSKASVFA
jgi:hypothetical protein